MCSAFLYVLRSVILHSAAFAIVGSFILLSDVLIPYPTAFPYGNGMVLHFYQQQESSTTKTVLKTKLRGLSPRANYTDRAAAAGRRS